MNFAKIEDGYSIYSQDKPISSYSSSGQVWRSCKENFIVRLPRTKFFFAVQRRYDPKEIIDYLHKLEDFINIPKSKIKIHKSTNEVDENLYNIIEVKFDKKWNYNKITKSLLLESMRSTFKAKPSKLIMALNKYSIEKFLVKSYRTYSGYLCQALNSSLNDDLTLKGDPKPNRHRFVPEQFKVVQKEFHKK